MPSALDRLRELALVLGADVRVLGVDYFHLTRNEPAQKFGLFIIDVL